MPVVRPNRVRGEAIFLLCVAVPQERVSGRRLVCVWRPSTSGDVGRRDEVWPQGGGGTAGVVETPFLATVKSLGARRDFWEQLARLLTRYIGQQSCVRSDSNLNK
eukprot:2655065-Pyramimonas_sp.AAC.1